MKVIIMARDGEIKVRVPGVVEKSDGTLWGCNGQNPLFGISDEQEKQRVLPLIKAQKWNEIPQEHFVKYGMNDNGVLAVTQEDWDNHPWGIEAKKQSLEKYYEKQKEEAKKVRIYLSSRGWGDFSGIEWVGDITRDEQSILAECRNLLDVSNDVDNPDQSDDELLKKIADSKAAYAAKIEKADKEQEHTAKKEERRSAAEMTTALETIEDEDGKTSIARHTVTLPNGNSYRFTDRNVFDFGRVINPDYDIAPNVNGGLRSGDCWETFESETGWIVARELTDEEKQAYDYVAEFGHHASSRTRM